MATRKNDFSGNRKAIFSVTKNLYLNPIKRFFRFPKNRFKRSECKSDFFRKSKNRFFRSRWKSDIFGFWKIVF